MTSAREPSAESSGQPSTSLHLPALAAGIILMIVGSIDPRIMADSRGQADHALAGLVMWAMSAGFVRGVGFVPRYRVARVLLSGWSCALAILAAIGWRLSH